MRSIASFHRSSSKINEEPSVRSKRKHKRTFHVQILIQLATESYLIHLAAKIIILNHTGPFILSGECTFKNKLKNDYQAIEEKET